MQAYFKVVLYPSITSSSVHSRLARKVIVVSYGSKSNLSYSWSASVELSPNKILDGKKVAGETIKELKQAIHQELNHGRRCPTLVIIQIGSEFASTLYVQKKLETCAKVGIKSQHLHLCERTKEQEVITRIHDLNQNNLIDAILIQLPLPKHIDANRVIAALDPKKDADGLHPLNAGKLAQNTANIIPCTPQGILTLLESANILLTGALVVVVGQSNLVGRPTSNLLSNQGATVIMCNHHTACLKTMVQQADILIVAIGNPNVIESHWIKPKAVVIDVGINRLPDGTLAGDINTQSALGVVSRITPVPGGVGPMTVASLISNCVKLWRQNYINVK